MVREVYCPPNVVWGNAFLFTRWGLESGTQIGIEIISTLSSGPSKISVFYLENFMWDFSYMIQSNLSSDNWFNLFTELYFYFFFVYKLVSIFGRILIIQHFYRYIQLYSCFISIGRRLNWSVECCLSLPKNRKICIKLMAFSFS